MENSKMENSKMENSKMENSKTENSKTENSKTENSKTENNDESNANNRWTQNLCSSIIKSMTFTWYKSLYVCEKCNNSIEIPNETWKCKVCDSEWEYIDTEKKSIQK